MSGNREFETCQKVILNSFISRIRELVQHNGPSPSEYSNLDQLMFDIGAAKTRGEITGEDIKELQKAFGDSMTTSKTLQGLVCVKPHGYAGDYEIIDKIYQHHISADPSFAQWDHYFQEQEAPISVRNRKEYFKRWLSKKSRPQRVLSLVGGPCRDILEYLMANPGSDGCFDAVEYDVNAISYAQELFQTAGAPTGRVNFIHANIFKFQPTGQYDVIWCSGMFDYLNEGAFVMVLKKIIG